MGSKPANLANFSSRGPYNLIEKTPTPAVLEAWTVLSTFKQGLGANGVDLISV